MKTLFTLTLALLFGGALMGQTVLVEWTFPDDGADVLADGGIAANAEREISSEGTSDVQFKNGATTKAAQATEWQEGSGVKFWLVEFTTSGYSDIQFSSKQSSGGNDPGPRNFNVQYKLGDAGEWKDIEGSEVVVANDWETGLIDQLSLPEECNNAASVSLRWIMSSNTASNDEPVASGGKSKIDDIVVTGYEANNTDDLLLSSFKAYPNPATSYVVIESLSDAGQLYISDIRGNEVCSANLQRGNNRMDVSGMAPGIYVLILDDGSGSTQHTKLVVR